MNLSDILSRHAQRQADAPAVIERGRVWSYREFDAAVWRAALGLAAHGIAAGDIVFVRLPTSALHLAASYALARLGATHLELLPVDARERHDALVKRFRPKAILVARPRDRLAVGADPAWLEATLVRPDPSLRSPGGGEGWKIALTSGSTGTPKAVLLTHAMQIAWCKSNQAAVPARPDARYLVTLDMSLDAGLRHCLFVHWAGGAVIIEEPFTRAEAFFAAAERVGATYLSLTPAHLHHLLASARANAPRLPQVRILRSGGMFHSETLRAAVRERISPNLYVMYGTNDGGSPLACASGKTLDSHPGAVGFPCPGVEIEIADDAGRPLPAGETGLIRIRAPGTPAGYLDDPEATARSFRGGWYYTGDLGWLSADGALHFKGRADDMMNFDGIKIYPSEIEQTLLTHPAVTEAAVIPRRSTMRQDVPIAAVTLRSPTRKEALQAYCTERLGVRAPRDLLVLSAMPRNHAGKIDKRELMRRDEASRKRSAGKAR